MLILRPDSLDDALALRAQHPAARAIAGGTDLMVELNFDRDRPEAILDLGRVPELRAWSERDGVVRIGAGVTYARLMRELAGPLPGLAMAARTVGSPQIRNRGTLGGNLATASPAGDGLPMLYACDAEVELASAGGVRVLPVERFVTGPKRTALRPDELVAAVRVPRAAGPQQFAKVGTRNAMVIAVCSVALALRADERTAAVCVGSAGPTPIRARDAEAFAAAALGAAWDGDAPLERAALDRFGALVAAAAQPIDDVRGSAAYRRHAVAVLARRCLAWAWNERRREAACA